MIVEMSRVLVVGPKRLLTAVVEEVQRAGAVHIDRVETGDAVVEALRLDEHAQAEQNRLEAARTRLDALLGLLPAAPSTQGAGVVGDLPPADDAGALEQAIAVVEAEVRELSRRRLEAEEEIELIRTYEGAVRALSPLMGALAGSKSLDTIGFILRGKDLTVVAALHNQLREATDGRVEVVSRAIEDGKIGVVVAFLRRDVEAVRGLLTRAGVAELRLPARYADQGPAGAIAAMEQRRAALPGELAVVTKALGEMAGQHRPRLEAIRQGVVDRLAQLQAVSQLSASRYMFILHGWAPSTRVAALRGTLRERFGGEVVVVDAPPDPHRTAEVPVLLDNHPTLKPFQRMLALQAAALWHTRPDGLPRDLLSDLRRGRHRRHCLRGAALLVWVVAPEQGAPRRDLGRRPWACPVGDAGTAGRAR
jgi:V/A-type H+-transporting ATPase subunit I